MLLPLLPLLAGVLLVVLRTGCVTGFSAECLPPGLDSREQAFVRCALQQDWRLRPTAAELVEMSEPYLREGPECEAAAHLDAKFLKAWQYANAEDVDE
jgi:hypothetical protein